MDYEVGLRRLFERIGPEHREYADALVLQSRLIENIRSERMFGTSENTRAERARCIDRLNSLCLRAIGTSFNDLCTGESERPHPDIRIETIGGAFVAGDVSIEGGDFVGRDQYRITIDSKEASREELLRAYYRSLANECSHLPLGIVDPKFLRPKDTAQISLHQVYVGLDVVAPVRVEDEGTHTWGFLSARGEGRERVPLLEALADPEATRVVLLGDPGSGKTTFINYLTSHLAAAVADGSTSELAMPIQDLLPMRFILREVATGHIMPQATRGAARMFWDALYTDIAARLGRDSANVLLPYLQQRLMEEGGLILLDGLDEVPIADQRRQILLEAVSEFVAAFPRSRVVITSRPYAYTDPQWQLPGFEVISMAPFDERQIEHFVDLWYDAIQPTMGWDKSEARKRGRQLLEALRVSPYLSDLATRPLLLNLMATLHTSWGQLPEDRADLYEEAVKLLLVRWQRARGTPNQDTMEPGISEVLEIGEGRIRAALQRLAYIVHRQEESTKQEVRSDSIGEDEVIAAFSSVLPEDSVGAVLNYVESRAGLLVGRETGIYAFPHRSFQEYLAACYLVEQPEPFESLSSHVRMDPEYWGEVFLLGLGKLRQGGLGNALSAIAYLLPVGPSRVGRKTELDWQVTLLAARAVLEVFPPFFFGEDRPSHKALLERIGQWLKELVQTPDALPEREQRRAYEIAGRFFAQETPEEPIVLGRLGNERYAYYTRTGNLADLEAAVFLYRKAIELASEECVDYLIWLGSLATALQDLHSRTGSMDSLYEVVELRREILSLPVREPALRSRHLGGLGRALCDLYGSHPDGDYLERALDAYRQAMQIVPSGSQELPGLQRQFKRTQQLYTQHRFFSLWDDMDVEDRKQRIQQFCELLSDIIEVDLVSFEVLPQSNLLLGILDLRGVFEGIPLPPVDTFPIMFSAAESVDPDYLDKIRQALSTQLGPNSRTALLIPISEDQEFASIRNLARGAIRQAYAYDIACLCKSDLETIVRSDKPRGALRHCVLSQTDLGTIPVYKPSGSTPRSMFFGREPELKEIGNHIKSTDYVLIGGRRIGKTSILKQLERARLPEADLHAFYHECSFTPTERELIQAVTTDRSWFPEPPPKTPSSLAEVIYTLPDDRLSVILLDEADKLIESDQGAGYPVFNTLRALSNADRCRFVLCGERALRAERTNPDSPLYNFGSEMLIGRLERHAVIELVTKPMSRLEITLDDESAMVRRIWDFTSGHPSVVQSLCQQLLRHLGQRGDRLLSLADVEAVVTDPRFLRKDFLDVYWERATVLERLCSLVMAANQDARTLTGVREVLTGLGVEATLNQVDDALERLVDLRNILKRTAEGYEFAVTAFPEVIAKTARLDDLIALSCESHRLHGDVEPRSKRGSA